MFSKIVNYAVRILLILLGVAMVAATFVVKFEDKTLIIVFGVITSLFGVYRLVMYRMQSARYKFYYGEDDQDEEQN